MTSSALSLRERWIILALALLTIAAHFVNLGLMPLNADEAIRASVAFEMMERENYIVPTIWGEYYYKKPPFYNWVLIGFFKAFGSFSEWVFRLPSVVPLMVFGLAIWRIARKRIGERPAILAAFAFLLNGSLLTRDSMLGHIDIFYALTTFLGFYAVYHFWRRGKYLQLFLVSYAIAGAGVLMKGLPSFLFQGLTLLAWFVYKREFKKLLSLPHFAGIALFVLIVGGYFYSYSQYNSLEEYFFQLYDQSSQRTVIDRHWYEGVLNILIFPFKNLMQLFPTALFLLFATRRGRWKRWMADDFTAFTVIALLVNVLPYWLSPGYHTRYLFMLYPLAFMLGAQAFYEVQDELPWLKKAVFGIFLAGAILLVPAFSSVFFLEEVRNLDGAMVAAAVLILASAALVVLWFRMPGFRVYWALSTMVLLRFGFDLFVIPHRVYVEQGQHVQRKYHAQRVLEMTEGSPLQLYKDTPLFIEYAYYLGVGKDTVMGFHENLESGVFYLALPRVHEQFEVDVFYEFELGYKDYDIQLVKLRTAASSSSLPE